MLLLSKLFRILFEPIAVIAGLGLLFLLWNLRRSQRHYALLVVIGGLLFVLGWRIFFGIGSSRYSAGLILPSVALSGYFCWQLSKWLKKHYRFPSLIAFACLILLLGGICILKHCRFNRYDSTLIQVGEQIAKDARNYDNPLLLGKASKLLSYCHYSGLPGRALDFGDNDTRDLRVIASDLVAYRQRPGVYYVILELTESELANLRKVWTGSDHVLLSKDLIDNRKKKVRVLWRYEPVEPQDLGMSSRDSFLIWGGDMEKLRETAGEWQQKLSADGINFFQDFPRKMPSPWTAVIPSGHTGAEVEADQRIPIAGEYSLRIKGKYPLMVLNEHALPAETQSISFQARGVPGSEFSIFLQYRPAGQPYRNEYLGHFRICNKQMREYLVPRLSLFDNDRVDNSLLFIKLNHGEIWVDNFYCSKK